MWKIILLPMAATAFGFSQEAELLRFYQAAGERPVWVQDGRATPRAREVINLLEHAETKGLDARDYDGPNWASRLATVENHESQDLMQFDIALTDAVMRYVSDLREGRANPGLYRRAGRDSQVPLSTLIRKNVLDAADLSVSLRELEPAYPAYWRTLEALAQYRSLASEHAGRRFPAVTEPVEPGDTYPAMPELARLLRALGDLPPEAVPPAGSRTYTVAAADSVKRFQARHGLKADGRIGAATLAQLNTPLRDRVAQLELALERWRWLPRTFSHPPVLVNLPEFRLRALDSTLQTVLEMKIIVGAARRTPTPLLAGELNQVIFQPPWKVPLSIQRGELLPEIKRHPEYLAAHGYEVTTSRGEVVTADVASKDTLARLRSGEFLLRQVPGPKNALGLVKFLFPNEASVYLHDTPAKALFAKVRRDFSHGCVRLENATEFAAWVLGEDPAWSREGIIAAMNGSETMQVNPPKPIPVMMTYMTAVVLETGEVTFLADLYGYDAELEKQLAGRADKTAATSGAPGLRPRE